MAKKIPIRKRTLLPSPAGKVYRFLIGFLSCVLAVFLFLSFISYRTLDPSLNTLIDLMPRNLMGSAGAISADLFYQIFGISSYFLIIYMLSIGGRLLLGRSVPHAFLRGLALLLCMVSISFLDILIRRITASISPGYNAMGQIILEISNIPVILIAQLLMAFFGLVLGGWSLGLRWAHIVQIIERMRGLHLNSSQDKIVSSSKKPKLNPVLKTQKDPAAPAVFQMQEVSYDSSDISEKVKFGQNYLLPPLNLLEVPVKLKDAAHQSQDVLQTRAGELFNVLEEFGVRGKIVGVRPGPVVTLFELEPAAGTKSSRVIGLADDIARSMSAISARVAVVPGKNVIGIELPNPVRETVYLRELLSHQIYEASTFSLSLVLGKDIGGSPMIADLAKMPHLLVAGTTGSGKSVSVNAMIVSILYRLPPEKCKFIMIDPKMLELSVYDGIPHLLSPVVTDPKKAVVALKWTVREMENRYKAMSRLGVRNIDGYNQKLKEAQENDEPLVRKVQTGFDKETGQPIFEDQTLDFTPLPFIVVVVDEMADLMLVAGKEIEGAVQRLAQMARAAGIHLIMATQRPSVDVITGTIKANFPTRISFQVTSKIDSRTILAEQGAEQLLGQGDMLYMVGGGRITRIHGAFVSDKEVERIVDFLKAQATPEYIEGLTEEDEGMELGSSDQKEERDETYRRAVEIVLNDGKISTSYIQRKLQIGYNRAARIVDQMEEDGVVSGPNHVGKREILGSGH